MSAGIRANVNGSFDLLDDGGTPVLSFASDGSLIKSNGALGIGQTWQDVLSSRASATVYTNNTGKPIQVVITLGAVNGAHSLEAKVDGLSLGVLDSQVENRLQISFIVPDGSTYEITTTGASFASWVELR